MGGFRLADYTREHSRIVVNLESVAPVVDVRLLTPDVKRLREWLLNHGTPEAEPSDHVAESKDRKKGQPHALPDSVTTLVIGC
jgi:hypothetical protein